MIYFPVGLHLSIIHFKAESLKGAGWRLLLLLSDLSGLAVNDIPVSPAHGCYLVAPVMRQQKEKQRQDSLRALELHLTAEVWRAAIVVYVWHWEKWGENTMKGELGCFYNTGWQLGTTPPCLPTSSGLSISPLQVLAPLGKGEGAGVL